MLEEKIVKWELLTELFSKPDFMPRFLKAGLFSFIYIFILNF